MNRRSRHARACAGLVALFLFCAVLRAAPPASKSLVETMAGAGWPIASSAHDLPVGEVRGLAGDADGNLYLSSRTLNRVLKLTPTGDLVVFAGNGGIGYGGDGGPATRATLNNPDGIAVDAAGNVYFSDRDNLRIRRVDATGTISTVSVGGWSSPRGLAIDDAGRLFVADAGDHTVRMVDATTGARTLVAGNGNPGFGGDGGPAVNASLQIPYGVTVRGSELFIADTFNSRIRKVDSTGIITTFAGGGEQAGDGVNATDVYLGGMVRNVHANADGTLTFSSSNYRLGRIDTAGVVWTVVPGEDCTGSAGDGGPANLASVCRPWGLEALPSDGLVFADSTTYRIRKIDPAGVITSIAGNFTLGNGGDGGPATQATLATPRGVAADANGNVVIADTGDNAFRLIDTNGTIQTILRGEFPAAVAMGPLGEQYMQTVFRLYKRTLAGELSLVASPNVGMRTVAVNGKGEVFVSHGRKVSQVMPDGSLVLVVDGGDSANEFYGLAVDDRRNIYIADPGGDRVLKADASGRITTFAGTGVGGFTGDGGPAVNARLEDPSGVALDPAGNVYIADSWNHRIRQVDKKGMIRTVVGAGEFGFNGDSVAAASVLLANSSSVAVGGNVLFIGDEYNQRIRKYPLGGRPK